MLIITETEEIKAYSEFMTKVSISAYRAAEGNVLEMMKANPMSNPGIASHEIGVASGQVVYDRVIELTKDMPREVLVKMLAQLASTTCIDTMLKDEMFRNIISAYSKLPDM